MVSVPVSFITWKMLTALRSSESETIEDVILALLAQAGVEHQKPEPSPLPPKPPPDFLWTREGVELEHGTQLRMTYRRQDHTAEIVNGLWMQNGEVMSSPSAAAWAIMKNTGNGWHYWFAKRPGDIEWVQLDVLRQQARKAA